MGPSGEVCLSVVEEVDELFRRDPETPSKGRRGSPWTDVGGEGLLVVTPEKRPGV